MNDKAEAKGPAPLEHFRDDLLRRAQRQLGKQARGKVGASDVVQQTFLEAHRKRDQFRGTSEAEMAAWLKIILAGILTDALRTLGRAKRDFHRERPLEEALKQAAEQSSLGKYSERHERAIRVNEALATLPEAQSKAIGLRYFEGLTVAEIGQRLDLTPAAVAGLLRRGLRTLRTLLPALQTLLSDCE